MSFLRKLLGMPFSLRQERLASTRAPMSKASFVDDIVSHGGNREAAQLIHLKLQDWIYARGFSPHPEDNLQRVYGIAEEELDEDIILDIFERIELRPPSKERLKEFGEVATSIDVARLVESAQSEGSQKKNGNEIPH